MSDSSFRQPSEVDTPNRVESMFDRARKIAGVKRGSSKKVAGEGLTASLLGDEADEVESGVSSARPGLCANAPDRDEADRSENESCAPDASNGNGASSGEESTSSGEISSTDLSHTSTDTVNHVAGATGNMNGFSIRADSGLAMSRTSSRKKHAGTSPSLIDAVPAHTKAIWLPEVMRQVPHGLAGIKALEGGGVEAVPTVRGEDVKAALFEHGFQSLLQLIPTTKPRCGMFALASSEETRTAATHAQLYALLERQQLTNFGIHRNTRCAVLLENGPELASTVMLCLARCTCVPINFQQTPSEIRSELEGTGCKALIVREGLDTELVAQLVDGLQVLVLELVPDEHTAGLFSLRPSGHLSMAVCGGEQVSSVCTEAREPSYNTPSDIALLLHTSGTSGKKKMVPYSLETLCVGAACIIDSWALTAEDTCLNMMPLFHVGGITRNILAAILAGGGVVCAPAFDAGLFWHVIESRSRRQDVASITWYYAGPTMHTMILEELRERRSNGAEINPHLRMVANASGGLIASLAEQMQQEFGSVVLPSYGMTECMPISSPTCDYKLDHPNSSGQICGPTVRILDDAGTPLGVSEVGNICLQGSPLMEGYLDDPAANSASFFPGGWFNTGDMGYLDAHGWIYLTGRSKEVINRGGEIISPFEIEQAISGHERVKGVLAFSAPHDVLQEVVGVAIVPNPAQPRIDLLGIQKHVASSLHPSKWPQVLVYIDELPKGQANKVQRIRLAQRLGLEAVSERKPQMLRMFEARCPPRGSSLQVPIENHSVRVDLQDVMSAIKTLQHELGIVQCVVVSIKDKDSGACVVYVTPRSVDADEMMHLLRPKLHDYLIPKQIILLDSIPDDYHSLPPPNLESRAGTYTAPRTDTERIIQGVWEQVLDKREIDVEADFFEVGGSSLQAGRLIAQVRRLLGVALTAASVFSNRTIADLAKTCDAMLESSGSNGADAVYLPERNQGHPRWVDRCNEHERLETDDSGWVTSGFQGLSKDTRLRPFSQTSAAALFVQALPLVLLYPLRRICTWLLFVSIWMFLQRHYIAVQQTCTATCSCPIVGNRTVLPTPTCSDKSGTCTCTMIDRLSALVLALVICRLLVNVALPLLGVLTKWLVIGRYRAGRYPLWGHYYLRWWFVDQVLMICGRGIFRHHPALLNMYYRMLGARIGPRVVIDSRAKLGEFDLISIGADTAIDKVRLRAFCLDAGCMLLAPLKIGKDVSIARKVALAPGIEVPDTASLGPNSSSYDLNPFTTAEENRMLCSARFPHPNLPFLALGYAIVLLVFVAEQLPVLWVLQQMVLYPWYVNHLRSYKDVLIWFLTPGRVGFYIALRVVRMIVCPMVRLFVVILLKRTVIGRFECGPWTNSQRKILRRWLMEKLLDGEKLQEVGHLIGSHYSCMTYVLRALGSKVGERIYWPGSSFEGLVEYDLLEVESDVVFGSRSAILCANATHAARVCIEAGANVSDRCVLLPGCTIGRNTVLGSGSLTAAGATYPAGSKWVGAKGGKAVLLERGSSESANAPTIKPFGKAFYLREASFFVLPSWLHLLWNAVCRALTAVYRSLTLLSVIQLAALVLGWEHLKTFDCSFLHIAMAMIPLFVLVQNVMTVGALLIAVGLKYVIIGTRKPGRYNWDESSYCQRWQLYLSATVIIRKAYFGNGILDHLSGSAYLVWFFRAHGCHIGSNVCLYPTGADPIMTEPELVQIGAHAAIDDASLIAHINSRGEFSLNNVVVGPQATLRSQSRLLSGAAMMADSTLLEHTLILGGDVVDEGATMQGWPAEPVSRYSPFWR